MMIGRRIDFKYRGWQIGAVCGMRDVWTWPGLRPWFAAWCLRVVSLPDLGCRITRENYLGFHVRAQPLNWIIARLCFTVRYPFGVRVVIPFIRWRR